MCLLFYFSLLYPLTSLLTSLLLTSHHHGRHTPIILRSGYSHVMKHELVSINAPRASFDVRTWLLFHQFINVALLSDSLTQSACLPQRLTHSYSLMSFRFGNFTTTDQLAAVVEAAVGGRDERTPIHPATRTFQVCMDESFVYGHVDRCLHSASYALRGHYGLNAHSIS